MQKWPKAIYQRGMKKVYQSVQVLADKLTVMKLKAARIVEDLHFSVINASTVLLQTVPSKSKIMYFGHKMGTYSFVVLSGLYTVNRLILELILELT